MTASSHDTKPLVDLDEQALWDLNGVSITAIADAALVAEQRKEHADDDNNATTNQEQQRPLSLAETNAALEQTSWQTMCDGSTATYSYRDDAETATATVEAALLRRMFIPRPELDALMTFVAEQRRKGDERSRLMMVILRR